MRRRKNLSHLIIAETMAAAAAAVIAVISLLSIWPTSKPQTSPGLEINYGESISQDSHEKDPPVIEYETGVIERTHDAIANEFRFEEAQELMKLAQAEAGNQGEDGMWLVMSTVLNRRADEDWPDSILEVINQHCKTKSGSTIWQFESVGNGMIEKVEISQEAHNALARIERGEVAPSIIAFETKNSDALDKYFMPAFEHKDHRFYTKK